MKKKPLDNDQLYAQLNERSRKYSAQLWQLPFAYVGILALGVQHIDKLTGCLRACTFLFLGIFSIGIFVHVGSINYYELRSVRGMQKLEEETDLSSGGSVWYLSFVQYVRVMLALASLVFFWNSVSWGSEYLQALVMIIVIPLLVFLWYKSYERERILRNEIRNHPE